MDKILNPDFGLIFWTWITFGILVFVLSKVAWKPILSSMKTREEKIKDELAKARESQEKAEQLKVQFESQLSEAQKTIQKMVADSKSDAEKSKAELITKAREEAEKILEKGRRDLQGETSRLKEDLHREVAGLALNVAEKVLGSAIDEKAHERVLQESLKSIVGNRS